MRRIEITGSKEDVQRAIDYIEGSFCGDGDITYKLEEWAKRRYSKMLAEKKE